MDVVYVHILRTLHIVINRHSTIRSSYCCIFIYVELISNWLTMDGRKQNEPILIYVLIHIDLFLLTNELISIYISCVPLTLDI